MITGVTPQQADQAMAEYARNSAEVKRLEAKMELEIIRIREKHADMINAVNETKSRSWDIVQAYALGHPELFTKKRSVDGVHGTFGFQLGQPRLKLPARMKEDAVISLLEELAPDYVKIKKAIDRAQIITDRETNKVQSLLPEIGAAIVQEDGFFIDPKQEDVAG